MAPSSAGGHFANRDSFKKSGSQFCFFAGRFDQVVALESSQSSHNYDCYFVTFDRRFRKIELSIEEFFKVL